VSGVSTDDVTECKPGLEAAREFGVRHPFVEAGLGREDIREMAVGMGLPFADVEFSPCLANRVSTGTRLTLERLAAIEFADEALRRGFGLHAPRSHVRGDRMLLDQPQAGAPQLSGEMLDALRQDVASRFPCISMVEPVLDPFPKD